MTEMRTYNKSFFLRTLDFLRNISIVALTVYFSYLLWNWHWYVAILGTIPVYILINNTIQFLTLPFYPLEREDKPSRKTSITFSRNFQNVEE